jgi:hypothetical protein
MKGIDVVEILVGEYGTPRPAAGRIVEIARQHGAKAEPVADGYVMVMYDKNAGYTIGRPGEHDAQQEIFSATLARTPASRYTEVKNVRHTQIKEHTMPGKSAAPAVEETEEGPKDYTVYATKEATPTMVDFAQWLIDEVGLTFQTAAAEAAFRKGVHLGGTLRMEFQRSDFNREQRAARAAERAAGNGSEEDETPATPKTTGRRTRGAKPTATETPAKTTGRRGRPRGSAAAAPAEAPF